MVSCPACGAGMRFDPVSQMVKCDHCETKIEPAGAVPTQYVGEQPVYDSTLYTCPQCGAEVVSDEDTVATFCSFCGASVMLQSRAVKMAAPSAVIPFKLTKEQCAERYKKMVKGAVYAPNYMKSEEQIQKFRGIYMPYWNYHLKKTGPTSITLNKSHRSGDYILTDHYNFNMNLNAEYKGFAFDASSSFADELSEAIAPYNVRENKPFSAAYLSGFYADTADVVPGVYEDQVRAMACADLENDILRTRECKGATVENDSQLVNGLTIADAQVSYFPVWFMANRHKDYVSYAVINGQTGKVAADIPIDYGKYILGSVLLAVPIILLLNLLFTFKPAMLLFIAVAFAVVCHILSNSQLNLLFTREHYLNDRGLQSVKGADLEAKMAMMNEKASGKKAKTSIRQTNSAATTVFFISFFGTFVAAPILSATGNGSILVIMFFTAFISAFAMSLTPNGSKKGKVAVVRSQTIYKMPAKEKMKTLIKPIIAEVMGGLLLIANPVQDAVYYCGVFAIMLLVLVCIWDLVKVHNRLTKRMPQQFGKRGGDENAGV